MKIRDFHFRADETAAAALNDVDRRGLKRSNFIRDAVVEHHRRQGWAFGKRARVRATVPADKGEEGQ